LLDAVRLSLVDGIAQAHFLVEFPCYRLMSALLTGGTYADSMPLPSPLVSEVIVNYPEKHRACSRLQQKAGILVPEKMQITVNNRGWLAETGAIAEFW
jgi:hypothetical protein